MAEPYNTVGLPFERHVIAAYVRRWGDVGQK